MSKQAQEPVSTREETADRKAPPTVVGFLKHPMFLLVMGSVLTYFIVPAVTARINQGKAINELKLKRASEISVNSIEFEGKINVLRAVLETFHDNQVDFKLNSVEFHVAQMELVRVFNERRFALSEKEWWWLRNLQRDAAIHNLVAPEKQNQFNADVEQYIKNVGAAHDAMRPLWKALKDPGYRPGDETTEKKIAEMRTKMAGDMDGLLGERTSIVDRISRLFAQDS